MLGPIVLVMILTMIVVPLPPILLDVLFTFNITFSLLILFAAFYTKKPLDFSAFPTVLLIATLLRLALNVAAARVILLDGYRGDQAAGVVIESFGRFVVGGSYVVGIVVFAILVIINFVVITKGSTRIAEVTARFSLDAMPGKQMAIDADLNAGMINQEQAKKRRELISAEADFYGSMDGASKFVRGDAIAAILIIIINLIGGLIVGVFQHGMSLSSAAHTYTLLSIGDGLVAQIPSLVISIAAGLLVSRGSDDAEMGHLVSRQLFYDNRYGLLVTAIILGITGIIPGMPHWAFLLYALLTGSIWYVLQRSKVREAEQVSATTAAEAPAVVEEPIDARVLKRVEPIGLAIGYQLIPLMQKDGELQKRLNLLRRRISESAGFVLPAIHVTDDLTLRPGGYRIEIHGIGEAHGEVHADQLLAIPSGSDTPPISGSRTTDPVYGATAFWIARERADDAELLGYTVLDAATVVTTHLHEVLQKHLADIFGLKQTQELLDVVARRNEKLLDSVIPRIVTAPKLTKVLRDLVREQVSLRDITAILESLAEDGKENLPTEQLVEMIRSRLGRQIVTDLLPGRDRGAPLQAAVMSPEMDSVLQTAIQTAAAAGTAPTLEPSVLLHLTQAVRQAVTQMEGQSMRPVILVRDAIRHALSGWLRSAGIVVPVLGFAEVPGEIQVKSAVEIR
ncbi:flagellar biosynthesis protein FlhA [Acidithiobacillus caldus]|nr:flagellar biosynthesis protein FlhA [Acidithiobacillus caldus]OFC35770.1 flagellar biosynthesis protein FlhA [Acidithiobacillus caldus]OFC35905.1 flagellar biosynthesis protein FlhA [Acidithiobacillus caldus]